MLKVQSLRPKVEPPIFRDRSLLCTLVLERFKGLQDLIHNESRPP